MVLQRSVHLGAYSSLTFSDHGLGGLVALGSKGLKYRPNLQFLPLNRGICDHQRIHGFVATFTLNVYDMYHTG